jgi:hypothetical protein
MAVTVTSHRTAPFQFFTRGLWAVERYVTIDDVEQSSDVVALFLSRQAAAAALSLPQFPTTTVED